MNQRSGMADSPFAQSKSVQEPVVPQGLTVLKEYILAYFYDLPQLL